MICNSCGNEIDSVNKFCPKCGAPVQYQAPAAPPPLYSSPQPGMPPPMSGPMYPPPRKSGCGKIILILVVILLLLGAGIGAAIYFGYRYTEKALKSSEPYMIALSALKENAEVKEQLGDIKDTGFPLGAFSQNSDGSGTAAFVMSVQGTRANAQYQVELIRRRSVWSLQKGIVRTASGDEIRVDRNAIIDDTTNTNSNLDTNSNSGNVNAKNTISGGVLNSKAISLPKPVYPAIAKAAHASGTVMVQVLVDEQGNVLTARAVSGHPLLQAAAAAAARQAKFAPAKLSGKAVKVSGLIKYDFTAE